MAQNEQAFTTIDPDAEDGTQLATRIDQRRDSYNSNHFGTLTPSYITPGGFWMRDNGNGFWNLMLARADGTSIAQWGINATSGQSDIISESKGDARYGTLTGGNTWDGLQIFENGGMLYKAPTLNHRAAVANGNTHYIMSDFSGNQRCLFEWIAATNAVQLKKRNADNTGWGDAFTIPISRTNYATTDILNTAGADGRYGRLGATNTWTGVQWLNGAVYTGNILQLRRTGADTQMEEGFNANRGSVHMAAQTTVGSGTWSMWGTGIGFGHSGGTRIYVEGGTGINEFKYRRQNGDISTIVHTNNASDLGIRRYSDTTNQNNTNYPIGTTLTARVGNNAPNIRTAQTVRISGSQFRTDVGSGTALSGTWRCMGQSANDAGDAKYSTFERVQ